MTIKPVFTVPNNEPHSLHIRMDKREARILADYLIKQGYWHQEDQVAYGLFNELLSGVDNFGS